MLEAPRKKQKTYNFHQEWEEEFIFTMVKDKCVCMLCHQKQALCKRRNLERHHKTTHQKCKVSYPPKSMIRAKKVNELKSVLKAQQSRFTKSADQNQAATEASFRVSHLLAKNKKPFTDGELFKEAVAITAETIFKDFKNKDEIQNALRGVPNLKLVAITTDGAPAMLGVRSGFIALCRNDPDFSDFVNYLCVIHQQALAGKVVDFSHIMTLVNKLINSIRAKALHSLQTGCVQLRAKLQRTHGKYSVTAITLI